MNRDNFETVNLAIEEAITAFSEDRSEETLAHVLTVIRRIMNQDGEFIVAVDANPVTNALTLKMLSTPDGRDWFYVFTGYDEQLKGNQSVVSGFSSEIRKIFDMALKSDDAAGVVINPWGKTLLLDKSLIRVIIG